MKHLQSLKQKLKHLTTDPFPEFDEYRKSVNCLYVGGGKIFMYDKDVIKDLPEKYKGVKIVERLFFIAQHLEELGEFEFASKEYETSLECVFKNPAYKISIVAREHDTFVLVLSIFQTTKRWLKYQEIPLHEFRSLTLNNVVLQSAILAKNNSGVFD